MPHLTSRDLIWLALHGPVISQAHRTMKRRQSISRDHVNTSCDLVHCCSTSKIVSEASRHLVDVQTLKPYRNTSRDHLRLSGVRLSSSLKWRHSTSRDLDDIAQKVTMSRLHRSSFPGTMKPKSGTKIYQGILSTFRCAECLAPQRQKETPQYTQGTMSTECCATSKFFEEATSPCSGAPQIPRSN